MSANEPFFGANVIHIHEIEISHELVESGNIQEVLKGLNRLLEPNTAKRLRSSINLYFSGYNDDPRRLSEIPEVRLWLKKLDDEFPY